MSTLILKGVSKRFGGLQAVAPFDMEIVHGRITGHTRIGMSTARTYSQRA